MIRKRNELLIFAFNSEVSHSTGKSEKYLSYLSSEIITFLKNNVFAVLDWLELVALQEDFSYRLFKSSSSL